MSTKCLDNIKAQSLVLGNQITSAFSFESVALSTVVL